ncbi:MAG TPA: TonB-dependent receptor [bacterium]|nr:TonB-dependent receptor [bacterium]
MNKSYFAGGIGPLFFTFILSLGWSFPHPAQAKKAQPTSQTAVNEDDDADGGTTAPDLSQMSLEKLADLDVTVTSSAKKSESLRDATSAIYVITAEDIRRSSARTLPDLLAMVPGVQVARQSGNEWAISARGFNSQYNNKMLVLVDGRNVYDPTFGKVKWNELDLFLPDIERIEVIRGPGGTLWGCNAVNGIVNIITKDSKSTQGTYLSTLAGLDLYGSRPDPRIMDSRLLIRYGGALAANTNYRIYGQFSSEAPSINPKVDPYEDDLGPFWNDSWYDFRVGGRLDWRNATDQVTWESEFQKGHFDYARLTTAVDSLFDPTTFQDINDLNTEIDQNAHLLLRWTRDYSDGSELQTLATYDYHNLTYTNDPRVENLGQFELQFQHRFLLGSWNEITYGGNYRNYSDQFLNPLYFFYSPDNLTLDIYGGYLQDRLTLLEGRLFFTGGVKLESNSFTGGEWQPSGRLLFTPDDKNSLWVAVSKAVRIPVQVGTNLTIYFGGIPADGIGPGTPPVNTYGAFIPNQDLNVENLISYEFGYRTNPTKETSLDLALFFNDYTDLFRFVPVNGTYPSPAGGVIDSSYLPVVQPQNGGKGAIYGLELAGEWKPMKSLKFMAAYTYQDYDQNMVAASNIETGAPPPHHLANGRVYFDPLPDWELNSALYFTDTTTLYDLLDNTHVVPAYCRWDLGLAWKSPEGMRFEIGATDLEGGYKETLPSAFVDPVQVATSLYTRWSLEF